MGFGLVGLAYCFAGHAREMGRGAGPSGKEGVASMGREHWAFAWCGKGDERVLGSGIGRGRKGQASGPKIGKTFSVSFLFKNHFESFSKTL